MHRKEVSSSAICAPPSSLTSLLFCFLLILFLMKEGKGMMEERRSRAQRCTFVRVFQGHLGGGVLQSWAVSHHAIDPPGSFSCSSDFIILLSS